MRKQLAVWVAVVVIASVASAGCKKPEDKPAVADAAADAASLEAPRPTLSALPVIPSDLSKIKSSSDPNFMTLSIADKLEVEKAHRPQASPNADAYFTEFEKLGAKWTSRKQIAAWTVGARYCFMSDSEKNTSTVICEFDDEKAAKAGTEKASKTNKILTYREVIQHKNVFIAVNDLSEGKGGKDEAKAFKDFAKKP